MENLDTYFIALISVIACTVFIVLAITLIAGTIRDKTSYIRGHVHGYQAGYNEAKKEIVVNKSPGLFAQAMGRAKRQLQPDEAAKAAMLNEMSPEIRDALKESNFLEDLKRIKVSGGTWTADGGMLPGDRDFGRIEIDNMAAEKEAERVLNKHTKTRSTYSVTVGGNPEDKERFNSWENYSFNEKRYIPGIGYAQLSVKDIPGVALRNGFSVDVTV